MNAKVLGIFLLLVVLCLFLAFTTPESFLKGNNIENLLRRTSMYGVLGIGVAFVIITSGIDLSIGSLVCLVACLLAIRINRYGGYIQTAEYSLETNVDPALVKVACQLVRNSGD